VEAGATERNVERCERRACVRRAAAWLGCAEVLTIGEALTGILLSGEGAADSRCFDKSKDLLKRKCPKSAFKGSNR